MTELQDKPMEEVQATYEQEKEKFLEKKKAEQLTASDDKKSKLRPKFEKMKEKVEAKKEQAAAEFKRGAYAEAITLYKQAAIQLDNAIDSFTVFKKEIAQMEAAIFGNIAFCFGKDK